MTFVRYSEPNFMCNSAFSVHYSIHQASDHFSNLHGSVLIHYLEIKVLHMFGNDFGSFRRDFGALRCD